MTSGEAAIQQVTVQNDFTNISFIWNQPWLAKLQVRVKRETRAKSYPVLHNWNHAKFVVYEHFQFHKTYRSTFRENVDHFFLTSEGVFSLKKKRISDVA